ncbi:hypothetical protein J1N35_005674 [Gossypium stocksii]|uniref:Putative plant transposon protein domain-containing protein n=1 Tax=Gossypium stocksii TaxID=47602 RepID=A0A9D3WEB6_9ROSI|nr:hypothetical protein J1N35_005674 [Gossypium stocksii]
MNSTLTLPRRTTLSSMLAASMLFDEESINAQFGLSTVQDEHSQFAATFNLDRLNQVFKYLCIKGTRWIVSRQACYIVDRKSVKPSCKVWYHFLKMRLTPSTYNFIVIKEQMLLLHSIMTSQQINVGKIIFNEVYHCTQKNVSLNFPSLVTAPCQSLQKNFTKLMLVEEETGEAEPTEAEPVSSKPTTIEKETQAPEEEADNIESVNIETDHKETEEATPTTTPLEDSTKLSYLC